MLWLLLHCRAVRTCFTSPATTPPGPSTSAGRRAWGGAACHEAALAMVRPRTSACGAEEGLPRHPDCRGGATAAARTRLLASCPELPHRACQQTVVQFLYNLLISHFSESQTKRDQKIKEFCNPVSSLTRSRRDLLILDIKKITEISTPISGSV